MRGHVIAVWLMVSTVASACSAGSPVSQPPTSPTTVVTGGTSSTSTAVLTEPRRPTKAPPVPRTLDITRYRDDPCVLLTREQQTALNLPQPQNLYGQCQWKTTQPMVSITLDLVIDLNYLTQVYLQSNLENSTFNRKEWVVFDPITVGGQPAVVLNATTQQTASGVLVATSPDDCIDVGVTIETGADPRATAIAMAEQIINNLTK
jgi:hypothetical protein